MRDIRIGYRKTGKYRYRSSLFIVILILTFLIMAVIDHYESMPNYEYPIFTDSTMVVDNIIDVRRNMNDN